MEQEEIDVELTPLGGRHRQVGEIHAPEIGDGASATPAAPIPPVSAADAGRREEPTDRCLCHRYEVVDPVKGDVVELTNCVKLTKSLFAPGHDARFKGMLIRAGMRGYKVRQVGTQRLHEPTTIALRVSAKLAEQVEAGIERKRKGRMIEGNQGRARYTRPRTTE